MTKVWLTGSSGMVGRNLQAHPKAEMYQVLAPNRSELDLLDSKAVTEWVAANQPDIVIHCAGKVGGISANMAEPVDFLDINTRLGRNVLMAARDAEVPYLINLSSSCFYPAKAQNPLKEDMVLTGALEQTNEGYALAKIVTMKLGLYISRENQALSYKTIIPCNLYGPWDNFSLEGSHMLPAVIAKLHAAKQSGSKEVEIWGDGTARREFMYAQDAADGIWEAASRLDELPDVMNLGVGRDHSINHYYAEAAKVIGWQGNFVHNLDRPVGMQEKLVDTSKQTDFGWRPTYALERGIAETYAHYLKHYA